MPGPRRRWVCEFSPANRQARPGDEAPIVGARSGSEASFSALYARSFGRSDAIVSARASNRTDVSAGGFRERAVRAVWPLDAFRSRRVEDLPIEEITRHTTHSEDAVRAGPYRAKRLVFEAADLGESVG